MKQKIALKRLQVKEGLKAGIPLFYHFIYFNQLESRNPFDYSEFNERTRSLVHFSRPGKPVSKIIDLSK